MNAPKGYDEVKWLTCLNEAQEEKEWAISKLKDIEYSQRANIVELEFLIKYANMDLMQHTQIIYDTGVVL